MLDIKTTNFNGSIASAEKVISSALQRIILSETYGTPAIFLKKGIEAELLKFYGWYYSTGRYNIKITSNIDETLSIDPMNLPDLDDMRNVLMRSFPYDL